MKTIRTKVYQFSELSEQAKKVAIERERKDYWEYGEPLYFFDEYCNEQAALFGFTDCKFQWSLSYSQGDGLSFSCGSFDLKKFLSEHSPKLKQSVIDTLSCYLTTEIKGNTGHYCYAHKNDVSISLDVYRREYPNIDKLVAELELSLQSIYLQLCKELEREGYSWIEAEDKDESIIDRIESNEWEYTQDGKRFN